jgi:hypothetical protein
VAHVELSVSEPFAPEGTVPEATGSLEHWGTAVARATEPCLVLDSLSSEIVAVSPSGATLLGFSSQAAAAGLHVFAGVLRLLDFTSAGARLSDSEMEKIPPILACTSGRLARGLLRVQAGEEIRTVDAIATPLFDGKRVVGSLTFFSQI